MIKVQVVLEKEKCKKEGRTVCILPQEHKCAGNAWMAVLPSAVLVS